MSDRIVQENARLDGVTDRSYWDAEHSNQIEGFTTDMSVNAGETVSFKINVNGTADDTLPYTIEIFRLGYYGGAGAREVAEIINADGTVQPAALFDESLGLVDAGNWSVSDQWEVPADAVSGVYLARIQRLDANGNPIEGATNQIPFIVRNDGLEADIVLQTSDTTWHAYNGWGGNNGQLGPNFYGDMGGMVDHEPVADPGLGAQDRAYAVSYNRPFLTRDGGGAAAGAQDYLFGADYAALFWLEKNGYDVSYISGVDTDRLGADYLDNYKAFISVGHDEYWSGDQRANVEAARDAGVNILFWSGNEVYWKTRWEDAISADGTPYRTLVCYKETWANGDPNAGPEEYANIDPSNIWTGTWRDVRFLEAKDADGNYIAGGSDPDPISGLYPQCHCAETTLTGQLFGPDGTGEFGGALDVPTDYGVLRYWRDTAADNGELDIAPGLIGYEWDVTPDDANRPEGLIELSSTTLPWSGILVDQGNRTEPGTATHNLTLYRAESGALVFAAGTVFWSWGLSNEHDSSPYGANVENTTLQQFTVNLFADMGIQPGSLQAGLTPASQSTDVTPALTAINDVAAEVTALSSVMITGTATDNDGNPATDDGVVAAVELSFDGGETWKVANGTTNWSYLWRPTVEGDYTIQARAIDDSLNVHNATPDLEAVAVIDAVPPNTFSLFDFATVNGTQFNENSTVEIGMQFSVDRPGDVTQLRYYRGTADSDDTDSRDGHLWRASDGALLGTVTFTSAPGESGWQIATLPTAVTLQPGVSYIVSYRTDNYYVASNGFFTPANEVTFDGVDDGTFSDPFSVISAPEDTTAHHNGLYSTGPLTVPTNTFGSSNYWVDITFAPGEAGPNTAPVITSGDFTVAENQTIAGTVTATDSDGDSPVYSIAGGADSSLFTINAATGVLSFLSAPDFEAPTDSDGENVYNVTIQASDGLDPVTKAITVTVTDFAETGGSPTGSTLFGSSAPANFMSGNADATNYELGTKFTASQDGNVISLRYYRGTADADDTDVRPLNLWNSSGTLLGSVTVTSTPGQTGWQVGTLATPISLTAGQSYIVSYSYVFNNGDGAVESYATTPGHFTLDRTGTDGVLTAPASGAPSGPSSGGIGNGLFAAGSPGAFPQQSYNASNYWVDVIFQAEGTGANPPPTFTSSSTFNALENQTAVGTVTAIDPNANPLTFAIAGGADANLFTIGATTGRLELKNPQDFEGSENIFEVTVGVSDGTNPPVTQAVTVNLTDVDENADGPAAMTGEQLQAQYIFGSTPTTVFAGAGATQTATVGTGVEFQNLPSAGPDVGNGDFGLATVDVREQTIRIEFPLDSDIFTNQSFIRLAGPSDGRTYNGILLSDIGSMEAIRSVRIIGQEGFTTSTGQLQPLTASDLTVTSEGIFLNVADKGRLVDVDADTPGAQAAWVELLVELNDPPVLTSANLTVAEGGTTLLTSSDLTLSDPDDSSFTFVVSDVTDGTFETLVAGTWSQTISFTTGQLAAGEVRFVHNGEAAPTFSIAANDGFATSAAFTGQVSFTAANDLPTGDVTISGTAAEGEQLTAANTLADEDGLGAISYQWLRDGQEISGATGASYMLGQADVGTQISVRASYTDGGGTSESVTSDPTAAVGNANDLPTGDVTISGTAAEGEQLTAANTLADEDGLGAISYQWLRDGQEISGATGASYMLGQADVGTQISVRASYTDGGGTSESVTSDPTAAVGNANDLPTGDVTISGTAAEGEQLTAANTLADEDGLGAISYQWLRDGQEISGATGASYMLGQADVGTQISVRASYTDGGGTSESVTSDPTAAVGNANDLPTGDVTISGTAAEGEQLTAANTLADEDGLGAISYQWLRDGQEISGATGASYMLGQADVGTQISVRASYTDGGGTSESVTSDPTAAVGNANDLPTGDVTISGTAAEGEQLTAANTLADEDGLGAISYQWLRDGQEISGATGASYMLGQADVGTQISVRASYTDGGGTSESVTSDPTAAVGNIDDDATGSLNVTGSATEGGSLTASLSNLSDDDGATTSTFQWQILDTGSENSNATWSNIANADEATLAIAPDQSYVGKTVRVVATTTDEQGGTSEFTSAGQTIANINDAPVLQNAIADQQSGEDAVFSFQVPANTFADEDGDELNYSAVVVDDGGNTLASQPDWLAFDRSTRSFSGSPPPDFVGYLNIKLIANDGLDSVADIFSLTITASGDSAMIGNPTVSSVTEDVGVVNGALRASGSISITDADAGEAAFRTTVASASGNLGTIALNPNGSYVYSVSNNATQSLGDGMTKVDTFTISAVDGTSKEVSFTIYGANEMRNGTGKNDKLNGTSAHETINGLAGNDKLSGGGGNDKLNGGAGNDDLNGGAGTDLLFGGAGNDYFIFQSAADIGNNSGRDVIGDFGLGADLIDLKSLDANTNIAKDQRFIFVAEQNTSTVANAVTWYQDTANGVTIVQGDINGDGTTDFQIQLLGVHVLSAGDFIL